MRREETSYRFNHGLSDYRVDCTVIYWVEPPDREVGLLTEGYVLEGVIVESLTDWEGNDVKPRDPHWWEILDRIAYDRVEANWPDPVLT